MMYSSDHLVILSQLATEFEMLRDSGKLDKIPEWRQRVGDEFGIHKGEALRDIRAILENRAKEKITA